MDVTSSVPESYVLRSKNSDVDKQVDELLEDCRISLRTLGFARLSRMRWWSEAMRRKTITVLWISARSTMTLQLRRRCF